MRRRAIAVVLVLMVVLAACTGDDEPVFAAAEVGRDTVVQTVAAAGVLQPVGRVTVTAPAAGEVTALTVADGARVEAGDALLTLRSEGLEAQLEQAEAALEAVGALSGGVPSGLSAALGGGLPVGLDGGLGVGLDVAPVVGALRAQLDAVIPPVLGALEDQIAGLEAAVVALDAAAQERGEATAAALREVADALGGQLPDELDIDPALLELPDPSAVLVPVDTSGLEASLADARGRLHTAQTQYRAASSQLGDVERQAAAQASAQAAALAEAQAAAEEAQAAAEEAQATAERLQRDQAEAAVQAVRDRLDALAIVAPIAGTVELARGGGGGQAGLAGGADLSALAEGLGAGDLGAGDLGDLAGLGALAGDVGGAPTVSASGPPTVGAEVGSGQPLLTIFDLGDFTAEAEVDELDVVLIEVGQPVVVLLDAFPEAELPGVVDSIGLEPRLSGMGGALYPVSVRLTEIPSDLELRIGMTASIEVEVLRTEGELVVPSSALLRRGGDEVVHVVRDGRVTRVEVAVLALGDGTAAIAGDLDVGDRVVTTGVELLEDGQEIRLEESGGAAAGAAGQDRP